MDWHFKTIARKSCLTDNFFVTGDKIVSLIYVGDKAEELGRADLLSTEVDEFKIDGDFIESQAFGYLAIRSLLNLPISFPNTTRCNEPSSGGVIIKNF